MIDLERILKIGKKNHGRKPDYRVALAPREFFDLINSFGRIRYLNGEMPNGQFMHEANYEGYIFKTVTDIRVSNI